MFPLPGTVSGGTQVLGFRLDAFSAVPSSILVTNIALGFAGVREPLSLTVARDTGEKVALQLIGPPGFNYRLESSTNLTGWKTIAVLVNTNGTVRFTDQAQTNTAARFYRAVVP